ncbi:MAG: dihydrofolate reductase [Bacteroidota bacterium]
MKPISIIVAIAQNNAIGKDNNLLWHLSDDLKHFKKLTSEHTVVMGKKTWESLPKRPLPNRKNIVLTDVEGEMIDNCITVYSIPQAIEMCDESSENFIIGGGTVYRQFLTIAQTLHITRVHKDFEADIFFPEIDLNIWHLSDESELMLDLASGLQFQYLTYQRKED